MAGKNTAVFGIYSQMPNLESALNELKVAGFRHEDISVLFPDNLGSKELATVKTTKAPEGAAAGASSGAVIGGALGWLVGIGALAIPGVGPLIAAGPIVAALAGVGAGGWHHRWLSRLRSAGIRSQALRRPDIERKHPAVCTLR